MSDEAMELLCTLSPHPASLRMLADDFNVTGARIIELMEQLQTSGFSVRRMGSRHGQFIHVQKEFWNQALQAALGYWRYEYRE